MKFFPGMLVEVIQARAHPEYLGARFVLKNRGPTIGSIASWETPFQWCPGAYISAEEYALRPIIDDGRQKKDWSDADNVWSPFVAPAVVRRRVRV